MRLLISRTFAFCPLFLLIINLPEIENAALREIEDPPEGGSSAFSSVNREQFNSISPPNSQLLLQKLNKIPKASAVPLSDRPEEKPEVPQFVNPQRLLASKLKQDFGFTPDTLSLPSNDAQQPKPLPEVGFNKSNMNSPDSPEDGSIRNVKISNNNNLLVQSSNPIERQQPSDANVLGSPQIGSQITGDAKQQDPMDDQNEIKPKEELKPQDELKPAVKNLQSRINTVEDIPQVNVGQGEDEIKKLKADAENQHSEEMHNDSPVQETQPSDPGTNSKKSTINTTRLDKMSKIETTVSKPGNSASGLLTGLPQSVKNNTQNTPPKNNGIPNDDESKLSPPPPPASSNKEPVAQVDINSKPSIGVSKGSQKPSQSSTSPSDAQTSPAIVDNHPPPSVSPEDNHKQQQQPSSQLATSPKSASSPGQNLGNLGVDGDKENGGEIDDGSPENAVPGESPPDNNNTDGLEEDDDLLQKGSTNKGDATLNLGLNDLKTTKTNRGDNIDKTTNRNVNDYKESSRTTFEIISAHGDANLEDDNVGIFSYFLTFVVICGVGFFMLHHRKRIIAMVLEGKRPRGGRTRRSSSGSYRKLENNFD